MVLARAAVSERAGVRPGARTGALGVIALLAPASLREASQLVRRCGSPSSARAPRAARAGRRAGRAPRRGHRRAGRRCRRRARRGPVSRRPSPRSRPWARVAVGRQHEHIGLLQQVEQPRIGRGQAMDREARAGVDLGGRDEVEVDRSRRGPRRSRRADRRRPSRGSARRRTARAGARAAAARRAVALQVEAGVVLDDAGGGASRSTLARAQRSTRARARRDPARGARARCSARSRCSALRCGGAHAGIAHQPRTVASSERTTGARASSSTSSARSTGCGRGPCPPASARARAAAARRRGAPGRDASAACGSRGPRPRAAGPAGLRAARQAAELGQHGEARLDVVDDARRPACSASSSWPCPRTCEPRFPSFKNITRIARRKGYGRPRTARLGRARPAGDTRVFKLRGILHDPLLVHRRECFVQLLDGGVLAGIEWGWTSSHA